MLCADPLMAFWEPWGRVGQSAFWERSVERYCQLSPKGTTHGKREFLRPMRTELPNHLDRGAEQHTGGARSPGSPLCVSQQSATSRVAAVWG